SSVRATVSSLENAGLGWEDIGAALSLTPAAGIALKGAGWRADRWAAVEAEGGAFLCTDSEAYAQLRAEWGELTKKSTPLAIAALSGVMGAQIGIAGGIIAPAVVWTLITGGRIGQQALCAATAATPQDKPPP